jgi:hypothetical protein
MAYIGWWLLAIITLMPSSWSPPEPLPRDPLPLLDPLRPHCWALPWVAWGSSHKPKHLLVDKGAPSGQGTGMGPYLGLATGADTG